MRTHWNPGVNGIHAQMASKDRACPFITGKLCDPAWVLEPRQDFSLLLCFCCFILSKFNFLSLQVDQQSQGDMDDKDSCYDVS